VARTAEAVVGGGGIIGASVLFQLGALGVRRAVLCEAAQPGAGATGASGAFIQLHFCRNAPETALTLASLPYFARWAELVGAGNPGFVPAGYLRLEPPERAAILRERVALLRALGCATSVIAVEEVERLAPYLHTEGLATAAYEPDSGYADAGATLAGFLAAARARGAGRSSGWRRATGRSTPRP
jgi:sarcosine oxidase subunit beta